MNTDTSPSTQACKLRAKGVGRQSTEHPHVPNRALNTLCGNLILLTTPMGNFYHPHPTDE